MKKEYSHYGTDDFLDDPSFRSFVYRENVADVHFWNDWIRSHPDKISEIEEAVYLLRNIYADNKGLLNEEEREKELIKTFTRIKKDHQVLWHSWRRMAAVIALILIPVGLLYWNKVNQDEEVPFGQVEWIEKVAPFGQKLTTKLSDGSVIKLNSGSRLRFPKEFSAFSREVYLEGEGFFEVKRDTSRRFLIHTEGILTTVLGTSFNIRAYAEDKTVAVAVATGKVLVQGEGRQGNFKENMTLNANEVAKYDRTNFNLLKSNGVDGEFSWTAGILYFDKTPVPELIMTLERWYGKRIRVDNEAFTDKTYSGFFENESLKNVLEGIKFEADINYKINENEVLIYE